MAPLPFQLTEAGFTPASDQMYVKTNTQVHYLGKCVQTVPYTHPDHTYLSLLSFILTDKYLHREVRYVFRPRGWERGGYPCRLGHC